jgi:hypothetical protein
VNHKTSSRLPLSLSDMTQSTIAEHQGTATWDPVLRFEAPYLIEKLLKNHIAQTPAEAEALFAEAKKYLVLCHLDSGALWGMYSTRVDEAWHQFVLFTRQYTDFCQRFFGKFLHHNPSNDPAVAETLDENPSTFGDFSSRYEEVFGEPLPDIWFDGRSIAPSTRVMNDNAGKFEVSVDDGVACLAGLDGHAEVLVDDIAYDALVFISRTGSFHVRELPGELTDQEKVGLISTLVDYRHLRVAP